MICVNSADADMQFIDKFHWCFI